MRRSQHNLLGSSALVMAALTLAACNGGGGGGASSGGGGTPTQPPAPPPLSEFDRQYGLGVINAQAAYDRGFTGQGVTVAVLDEGFDLSEHPELEGQIVEGFNYETDTTLNFGDSSDRAARSSTSHGNHVAGIIAANEGDGGMHGVSYDAKIMPFEFVGSVSEQYGALAARNAVQRSLDAGAQVLNMSFSNVIDIDDGLFVIGANHRDELNAMLTAARNGMVPVVAAGNQENADPDFLGMAPLFTPENEGIVYKIDELTNDPVFWEDSDLDPENLDLSDLNGRFVVVVAVDEDGEHMYNACGRAQDWCIAAPGENIYSLGTGSGYTEQTGTSMAAPHVSGALAIMIEAFGEQVGIDAIISRLFSSADKSGRYGDSDTYGQGLLDLERATRPMGEMVVASADRVDGPRHLVTSSSVTLGSAFGDALDASFAAQDVMAFDEMGFGFYVPMSHFMQNRPESRSALDRLQGFAATDTTHVFSGDGFALRSGFTSNGQANGVLNQDVAGGRMTLGFNQAPGAVMETGHSVQRSLLTDQTVLDNPAFTFAEEALTFGFSGEAGLGGFEIMAFSGDNGENDFEMESSGATFAWNAPTGDDTRLALEFGFLQESDTFLGSRTQGAFSVDDGVTTYFTGVSGGIDLTDTLELVGSAHFGQSSVSPARNSLIRDMGSVTSTTASLGLAGRDLIVEGSSYGVIASQPLRVEQANASMSLPVMRRPDGSVIRDTMTADLTPSGREVSLQAYYSQPVLDDTGSLSFGAQYRHQPNHVREADDEILAMSRLSMSF